MSEVARMLPVGGYMRMDCAHLTIIVGGCPVAEELRRSFVKGGVPHASVVSHLRGFRRSLHVGNGEDDLVILCVSLDERTLNRHGETLRTLMADRDGFDQSICTVGLLEDSGITPEVAELGCDVYVQDSSQAVHAFEHIVRETKCRRVAKAHEANRFAEQFVGDIASDSDVWDTGRTPGGLRSLVTSRHRRIDDGFAMGGRLSSFRSMRGSG